MVRRLRSFRLSLILLLLFLGTAVQAQSYPDPSAEAHAWTLHRAYKSGDSYTFEQQVRSDPTLTKKAFLFVVTYFGQQLEVNYSIANLDRGNGRRFPFAISVCACLQGTES